jgi:hypothetical protein
MNMERTEAMRISRQPSLVGVKVIKYNWIMWNVLAVWIACKQTTQGDRPREVTSRIVMVKAAFTSKLDLILRKTLLKLYIWNIALYGAEPWTVV